MFKRRRGTDDPIIADSLTPDSSQDTKAYLYQQGEEEEERQRCEQEACQDDDVVSEILLGHHTDAAHWPQCSNAKRKKQEDIDSFVSGHATNTHHRPLQRAFQLLSKSLDSYGDHQGGVLCPCPWCVAEGQQEEGACGGLLTPEAFQDLSASLVACLGGDDAEWEAKGCSPWDPMGPVCTHGCGWRYKQEFQSYLFQQAARATGSYVFPRQQHQQHNRIPISTNSTTNLLDHQADSGITNAEIVEKIFNAYVRHVHSCVENPQHQQKASSSFFGSDEIVVSIRAPLLPVDERRVESEEEDCSTNEPRDMNRLEELLMMADGGGGSGGDADDFLTESTKHAVIDGLSERQLLDLDDAELLRRTQEIVAAQMVSRPVVPHNHQTAANSSASRMVVGLQPSGSNRHSGHRHSFSERDLHRFVVIRCNLCGEESVVL